MAPLRAAFEASTVTFEALLETFDRVLVDVFCSVTNSGLVFVEVSDARVTRNEPVPVTPFPASKVAPLTVTKLPFCIDMLGAFIELYMAVASAVPEVYAVMRTRKYLKVIGTLTMPVVFMVEVGVAVALVIT